MIGRYSRPGKWRTFGLKKTNTVRLEVEILADEAWAELGENP